MRELVLPWPSRLLSPNARVHWSQKSKATKAARQLAWALAREAGWHDGLVQEGRLHLWWDFYPPDRRRRDDDNCFSSTKSYRDGIADAIGVDDRMFVSHPWLREEVRKGGEVRVRITVAPEL